MIDFAMLPPEVNSGRMYAGAGSGPMMAAAAAWAQLAAVLSSAASSYQTVISELTGGPWRGAASASMAAAAEPYVDWMHTTAARAEQTADQAWAAAAAYEQAFAATVPPPVIAANRAAFAALVATNFFGQNTPAIAANQAEYAEMWAQDATAMYNYAASTATATTLPPLAAAPQTANPAGLGAQAGATGQTAAPAASQSASVAGMLQALGNPITALANGLDTPTFEALNTFLNTIGGMGLQLVNSPFISEGVLLAMQPLYIATGKLVMLAPAVGQTAGSVGLASAAEGAPAFTLAGSYGPGMGTAGAAGLADAGVSAGMGRAAPVGGLSVPPSWGAAAQEIRLAATASPMSGSAGLAAPPEAEMVQRGGWHGGIPPAGSVVSTPAAGESRGRSRFGCKAISRPTAGADADATAQNRWAQSTPAGTDSLSESERNELDGLREEMADLAGECDAMARWM